MRNRVITAAETLGVPPDANRDTLKNAYRRLAKAHHPDRAGGDKVRFQGIVDAFDFLTNESERKAYERDRAEWLRDKGAIDCPKCGTANAVQKGAGHKCGRCGLPLTEWTLEGRLRQEGSRFLDGTTELAKKALDQSLEHATQRGSELGRQATELAIDWFRAKAKLKPKRGGP